MNIKTIIAASCMVAVSGCNMGILDFNYKFDKAEIRHPDGSAETVEVKKWWNYDDGDQVQVLTKDGRIILTHSMNVVLIGRN